MKAMILAAGRGERMGSLTSSTPKPLVKVGNKTLIEYNLHRLENAGIKEIVINVSWLGNQIIDYLGDGRQFNFEITYLDEGKNMLGTGGGILNALNILGNQPFWLINADIYTDFKINLDLKLSDAILGHLFLVKNPSHHPNGDFGLEKNKVTMDEKFNPYTFSGMSLISAELFNGLSEKVFALEPLLKSRVREGKISGQFITDYWVDIGTQDRLKKLRDRLEAKKVS